MLGKLLYQQNQDATYINKLTTDSFKQVRRIKMTRTQLCVYVDSLGITVVQREIEDNGYAKFRGVGGGGKQGALLSR